MSDDLLPPDEVDRRLGELATGWTLTDGKLHRELRFKDFGQAFAFMTHVALAAEKLGHHPDWSNSWNRVTIDIVSHDVGGLTARCFDLARAVDGAAATG